MFQKKTSLVELNLRKPSIITNQSLQSHRSTQLKSPSSKGSMIGKQPYFKSFNLQEPPQDSPFDPNLLTSNRFFSKRSQPQIRVSPNNQVEQPGPTVRNLSKPELNLKNIYQVRIGKNTKKLSIAGRVPKELSQPSQVSQRTVIAPNRRIQTFTKGQFNYLYVIGVGGFGRVWKVQHHKSGQVFAMKEMSKALIIAKTSVSSVMNERKLLSELKHPFLVNMHFAFQDSENLYLGMDYMMGGDLRYHIGKQRRFSEEATRFFVACIIQGLEFIHGKKIIHRDIKPENLVLDEQGFVHITDLGIARLIKYENKDDTSGTPGYMAPEVMLRQNHSYPVDFFAVGVIAYEFMMGKRPYPGRSRNDIKESIIMRQAQIKRSDAPLEWSDEALDFINRLLQRKPSHRLGTNGIEEVKGHPWFKNFSWEKLQNKQMQPPFVPLQREENFDQRQILAEDEENQVLIQQNTMLLKDPQVHELFIGYEYSNQRLKTQANSIDFSSSSVLQNFRRSIPSIY